MNAAMKNNSSESVSLLQQQRRRLSTEGSDYSSRCASGQASPQTASSPTRTNSGSTSGGVLSSIDYVKCEMSFFFLFIYCLILIFTLYIFDNSSQQPLGA
jgi:hypothetical protein